MKPLFAIDITEDKNNGIVNGRELAVQSVPEEMLKSYLGQSDSLDKLSERASLPLFLKIIEGVSFLIGCIGFAGVMEAAADIGFRGALRNGAWVVALTVAMFVVSGVIFILGIRRNRAVLGSEEAERTAARMDLSIENMYNELGVPDDAPSIDIWAFRYKLKDGEIKNVAFGLGCNYSVLEVRAFSDGEYFYIADVESRYGIPKQSIKGIRRVDKRVGFAQWSKDEDYKSEKYKKYKIAENDSGILFVKPYYILDFTVGGEDYCLYFPPYELEIVEELTGVRATDENNA